MGGPFQLLTVPQTSRSHQKDIFRRAPRARRTGLPGARRGTPSRGPRHPAPAGRRRRTAPRAWRPPWRRSAGASTGRRGPRGRARRPPRSAPQGSGQASWPSRSPRACPVNRPGPSPTATPPTDSIGVPDQSRRWRSASATISWPARSIRTAIDATVPCSVPSATLDCSVDVSIPTTSMAQPSSWSASVRSTQSDTFRSTTLPARPPRTGRCRSVAPTGGRRRARPARGRPRATTREADPG